MGDCRQRPWRVFAAVRMRVEKRLRDGTAVVVLANPVVWLCCAARCQGLQLPDGVVIGAGAGRWAGRDAGSEEVVDIAVVAAGALVPEVVHVARGVSLVAEVVRAGAVVWLLACGKRLGGSLAENVP